MAYTSILMLAITAAKRAGELLRSDFHLTGGPRGRGDHADADGEAEAVIRECLRLGTPEFGIVGEELSAENTQPSDLDNHVWLVDPNDGTASYLKGYRGSAVSIALLRAGRPVLGVVFAFAAPQDEGDLITWAEGEPLTRNGKTVIHPGWATQLEAGHTVLVSQSADNNAAANLEMVKPARFRTMPSIAYRLALAAVGEAQAAVSLNGPCGWDYAAGHALLRAVGGELFDSRGQPVQYDLVGNGRCGQWCFGGSPTICPSLAASDWHSVFRVPPRDLADFDLCQPKAGRAISDAGLLARAHGCLLGQLAGDALGGIVEFASSEQIKRQYLSGVRELVDGGHWNTLAGQPTDDSELALILARSLVHEGRFDLPSIAQAYVAWYKSRPFDMGSTTRQSLGKAAATRTNKDVSQVASEAASTTSQANGALMRISPLALFGYRRPSSELIEWARLDARLTHAHPVCQDASAAFVLAIQIALSRSASPVEVFELSLRQAKQQKLDSDVIATLEAAKHGKPIDYLEHMGWVRIALQNAFYQLLYSESLESSIVDTIMQGGDTDTNAAIAGALLGAVHGLSAVPMQWQDRVLTCRPIAGLTSTRHPRPRPFWPVDALVLAEHLLTADRHDAG